MHAERKIRLTQKPADFSAGFIIDATPDNQVLFLLDWTFSPLPQRCNEHLPGDASYGCRVDSILVLHNPIVC
jgi:hypothetical protein